MKDYTKFKELLMEDMKNKELKIKASEEFKAFIEASSEIEDNQNDDELIKRVNEKVRKLNENAQKDVIFDYFHGGFGSFSEHFYIIKDGDNYLFKYGADKYGRIIKPNDTFIRTITKDSNEYHTFINKLNDLTKDWEEKYSNNDIVDGTQWQLKYDEKNFYGSNNYPNNYNEVSGYILDYFGGKYKTIELSIELLEKVRIITDMYILSLVSNQRVIPDLEAVYLWNSVRGGKSIIIRENGEYLLGNSSVNPSDMIKDFKEGKRTGNLNN